MKVVFSILFTFVLTISMAQEQQLPFKEIPGYPDDYKAGNIVKRTIDGLGYRYHWASEGLSQKDLSYRPSEEARDLLGTLRHIFGLSETILNAALNKVNVRPSDFSKMTFEELRLGTLANLKKASDNMENMTPDDLSKLKVSFQNGDSIRSYDYWHMINGPISDAIYHVGQVVSFRRSSGNPMNPKVNVFQGKNRS